MYKIRFEFKHKYSIDTNFESLKFWGFFTFLADLAYCAPHSSRQGRQYAMNQFPVRDLHLVWSIWPTGFSFCISVLYVTVKIFCKMVILFNSAHYRVFRFGFEKCQNCLKYLALIIVNTYLYILESIVLTIYVL